MTTLTKNRKLLLWNVALLLVALLAFHNSFGALFYRWFKTGSYYSHGPFVFLVFLWFLKKRIEPIIPVASEQFSIPGAFVILSSIFLNLTGQWFDINMAQNFALFSFVTGNCLYFLGWSFFKRNVSLFLYLLLAIPLPSVLVTYSTFGLRMIASKTSYIVLSVFFESVERHGNIIEFGDSVVTVTSACSGLNNIFGMVALIGLLAALQTNRKIAILDLLLAIPAALLSNVSRIVVVCILVAKGYGQFALEDYHEEIGILMFFLVFFLVVLFNDVSLKKIKNDTKVSLSTLLAGKVRFYKLYFGVVLLAAVSSFFIGRLQAQSERPGTEAEYVASRIPKSIADWDSYDEELGEYYFQILGTDNLLMRVFSRDPVGFEPDRVYLYVIHSSSSRKVAHPPELCIKGEGYEIHKSEEIVLLKDSLDIPARRVLFTRNDQDLLVYYWYRFNDKNTNSLLRHQFMSISETASELGTSMIRLSIPFKPGSIEHAERLLRQFVSDAVPVIIDSLDGGKT
ncbi:MAG: EpsI family protein [Proteobacteria bacterium]|nr:EpsI family protein [Pseudomonadota bacterium]